MVSSKTRRATRATNTLGNGHGHGFTAPAITGPSFASAGQLHTHCLRRRARRHAVRTSRRRAANFGVDTTKCCYLPHVLIYPASCTCFAGFISLLPHDFASVCDAQPGHSPQGPRRIPETEDKYKIAFIGRKSAEEGCHNVSCYRKAEEAQLGQA